MGSLWNRSGTFERVGDDVPAAGAKAYFYLGGTTTQLTVYRDAAEASAFAHPLTADAYGRWPDVFVPYTTSFDVEVTTAEGQPLTYTQQIPNPDPIDLSVTIPAENQVQTGMIHGELYSGVRAGYVRLNGRTIGNAVSSATERANADTEDLFVYLWDLSDTIAPVSGGRGASGAADFAANKAIVLPSCRGVSLIGLDDMGNSAASAFSGLTFDTGDATTAGSAIGINSLTLSLSQLPAHTHNGTTSVEPNHTHTLSGTTGNQSADHYHTTYVSLSGTTTGQSATHTHSYTNPVGGTGVTITGAGPYYLSAGSTNTGGTSNDHTHDWNGDGTFNSSWNLSNHTHDFTTTSDAAGTHSHTYTTSSAGSGAVVNNLPKSRLVTWFIKL